MSGRNLLVALFLATLPGACQQAPKDSAPAAKRTNGEAVSSTRGTQGSANENESVLTKVVRALKPEPITIPEGTKLPLVFEMSLSSETSRVGDLVLAKLAEDVRSGERVLLPAGAEIKGRVTAAVSSGRVKGRARLALNFDRILVEGKEHPIETRPIDITAPKTHKRDAAIIGGGAGAGAIIGAIADGGSGARTGALIGAGAGTATVLATKGKEVEFPAGTTRTVVLRRAARLE